MILNFPMLTPVDTWFVVCGGPSLVTLDWTKLRNKNVIAVNRSFEKLPFANIIYFSDKRFFDWNKEALLEHPGKKITGSNLIHEDVENYKITGRSGLDLSPKHLRSGNNSGYAALNLAVHQGAKTIYVLGLDMHFDKGKTHWHDGYIVDNRERQFKKMLPYFQSLADELECAEVKVFNCNPGSALGVFEKITLEEVLNG